MRRFKILAQPNKPSPKKINCQKDISYGDSGFYILQILKTIEDEGVNLVDAEFITKHGYDDTIECHIRYKRPETEEEFKARWKYYQRRLEKYEQWAKENKEKIAEELALRAEEEQVAKIKHLEKKAKKAELELHRFNKKLTVLKKEKK